MKNFKRDCERKDEPITFTEGEYSISNAILCNYTASAIYFNTKNNRSKLWIECCSFSYDTNGNGSGGAVYFVKTGEIVFSRVNGIYCNCHYSGHFSYTVTQNSKSSLNYSSLSSCSTEMKGDYASCFYYCQEMSDTNISYCKGHYAGFLYYKSSSKSFAQLSHFYNQSANDYSYSYVDFEFGLKTIKCNYIRNSAKYLIDSEHAHLFVEKCNILNNEVDGLFYALYNGKITVINCCLLDNSYTNLTLGRDSYS